MPSPFRSSYPLFRGSMDGEIGFNDKSGNGIRKFACDTNLLSSYSYYFSVGKSNFESR